MVKSTIKYWNTLAPENSKEWQPIKGLEADCLTKLSLKT
jgi:hypothetical protein